MESMKGSLVKSEVKVEDRGESNERSSLGLDDLNIHDLIRMAHPLVASQGSEFSINSLQDQQTLQQQKKHLKARLGLDGLSGQLVSTDDFIADEDFEIKVQQKDTHESGATDAGCILESRLSAREKAMSRAQKRKLGSCHGQNGSMKKSKVEGGEMNESENINKASMNMLDDAMSGMWPFQRISDKLCVDLLHPCWETRHGAAMGLRSILRYQSNSAGIFTPIVDVPTGWLAAEGRGKPTLLPITEEDLERAKIDNSTWIEECVMHLICVLALDRFGDYISDGVIAPVRETAAQVLGVVASTMNDTLFFKTIKLLSEIACADHWEPRHGSISALKYILVARGDLPKSVFLDVVSVAMKGLEDQMEDVRSVSAECLIPCAKQFADARNDQTKAVIEMLWDALLSLDPINVATKSAAKLLECLFMQNLGESAIGNINNVPRLWYHFSSRVPSTRSATIQCYHAIIQSGFGIESTPAEHHLAGLFSCIQVIATDNSIDICKLAEQTAHLLITCTKTNKNCPFNESVLDAILDIACFTSGKEFKRPCIALLPDVQDLVDREELETPKYVPKEISSERRFLICGIAAAMARECKKLEPHFVKLINSCITGTSGMQKQIGALILLTQNIGDLNQVHGIDGILNRVNEALMNNKHYLDEFNKPYESVTESFAKIGICDFDFRARTVDEIRGCIPKDLKGEQSKVLVQSFANLKAIEENFVLGVLSLLASAIVQTSKALEADLPSKLNHIIQPLIAGIRREKDEFLQGLVADSIAELVMLSRKRNPSPSSKIVKNLCIFACADRSKIFDFLKPSMELDPSDDKIEERIVSSAGITSRVCVLYLQPRSYHASLSVHLLL